jgi:hypothetical protein
MFIQRFLNTQYKSFFILYGSGRSCIKVAVRERVVREETDGKESENVCE